MSSQDACSNYAGCTHYTFDPTEPLCYMFSDCPSQSTESCGDCVTGQPGCDIPLQCQGGYVYCGSEDPDLKWCCPHPGGAQSSACCCVRGCIDDPYQSCLSCPSCGSESCACPPLSNCTTEGVEAGGKSTMFQDQYLK